MPARIQPIIQAPRPCNAAPLGVCSVCGDQHAPQRPYLPPARAYVCDSCWDDTTATAR
jgi:hypothetical protein